MAEDRPGGWPSEPKGQSDKELKYVVKASRNLIPESRAGAAVGFLRLHASALFHYVARYTAPRRAISSLRLVLPHRRAEREIKLSKLVRAVLSLRVLD
jgi:hypothetical protein